MKKIVSLLSVAVLCVSMSACDKKDEKKEEINIPILETNEENYNTVTAEVGNITMSYTVEGGYSYPYSSGVAIDKGGIVENLYLDPSEEVTKGQLLLEINTDEFDSEIEAQQLKVDAAQKIVDDLKNSGASQAEIDVAQCDYDIEKNNLDKLNAQLESYKVYAPIDGTIEMDGLIEDYAVGMEVYEGQYIGTIIDRSQKKLTASVYGDKLENVQYGTKVDIQQGNVASGTGYVTDIIFHDRGDFSTHEYVIAVEGDTEFYDFGVISVNFRVYEKENVVTVPQEAITNVGNRTFVYTIVDGIRIETDVEVGITDEIQGTVEITSGLSGGETIVI